MRKLTVLTLAALALATPALGDEPPVVDVESGRRAYERCAVCHREDGAGRADGTFPKIAGQHSSVIEAQLVAIRSGRRPNPVMEPHARTLLDDRELSEVAAYIASLPTPSERGLGPGEELERGERIYRADCVGCHGEGGEGDAERLVPVVAGQHYAYLLRRARSMASWGRNGHPATQRPLDEFTDAELRAVIDYAARLSTDGADAKSPN
ncbi:MAG: cytochrome c4 [Myxococcota bacterium]|nr:cytochrome c4 [Myxococcota bacterium]